MYDIVLLLVFQLVRIILQTTFLFNVFNVLYFSFFCDKRLLRL